MKFDLSTWNGITLIFDKFIVTKRARYSYRELELFAELGGYVGLFLGISVMHLKDVFDKFLSYYY